MPVLCLLLLTNGCALEEVKSGGFVQSYQEALVEKGPQERTGPDGLESISALPAQRLPILEEVKGPAGNRMINLTLENAVIRALSNSPEISVVSYDPAIAKEGVTAAASEFDITTFGQFGYNKYDSPSNNISEDGQSRSSIWEAGVRQKGVTGAEWRLTYSMSRTVDDSPSRVFSTSYEPALIFKLKQPLLRDAWTETNLAGVNISKLNYMIALTAFRQKTEDVSAQVVSLYWTLVQARSNVGFQQRLLDMTIDTLRKVEDRKDIDATIGDIKQAEAAVKRREAALFDADKQLSDVQDELVRLLADHQMKLIDNIEIVPTSAPDTIAPVLDQPELIKTAIKNNPEVLRSQMEVEVARINVAVAKKQEMPRLDIVATAQLQGLSDAQAEAADMITDREYKSYTLGVTFEYPFGNREKKAELRQRELRYEKALSKLQNVSDQAAALVKERIRLIETAHKEIQVQKDAVSAARIYLQVLEDVETVRKKLTPEFLLAKIQAQELLTDAERAEVKAITDYNISLAKLAQATGTVMDLQYIKESSCALVSKNNQ